jgi:hypothetical protein
VAGLIVHPIFDEQRIMLGLRAPPGISGLARADPEQSPKKSVTPVDPIIRVVNPTTILGEQRKMVRMLGD